MDWRRNHLSLLIIPIKALLMMAVLKSVCEFFPCVYDSVNWTNFLKYLFPLLFHHHKKKKEETTDQPELNNKHQTNPTIITNLDKEGLVKTAPVPLSPYLSMQPSEMHLKVLTQLTGVTAEILYLKDYEDWKGSLLTGKKANGTPILKKDQKDNSGKPVNWP